MTDTTGLAALEARLIAGARDLGVPLDAVQRKRLLRFTELLDQWGAVYNLSAIRGTGPILQQHVLDCLAIVTPVVRWAEGRAIRVLDVGSGAGLPGVVMAIARPDWSVSTVDAVAKKVAFVRQVAGELSLANLEAIHGRAESLKTGPVFDLITCRALAALSDFIATTRRCLHPHGVWAAMKGVHPADELATLPPNVSVFHVEPLKVPGLDASRCLVWIRPN